MKIHHLVCTTAPLLVVGCTDVGGTQRQNNMERVDSLVKGKGMIVVQLKPSVGMLCQFSIVQWYLVFLFTVPLLPFGFNSRLDTASESQTY